MLRGFFHVTILLMNVYRTRLRRSQINRILGGVCGGMGATLGISAWWVRAAFAALSLTMFSFALLLYLLLWVIMPAQRIADLPPLVRPGEAPIPHQPRPEGVLILGGLAILVGIIVLAKQTGVLDATGGGDLLSPAMMALVGVVVLVKHLRGIA